jgi:superfamily II DNA or RNA helicase
MTEIILRDYQSECVESVLAEWQQGHHSTLAVLSTGAGKTEIALATLAAELKAGRLGRVLFLVHTIELVTQPLERIDKSWPEFQFMTGVVQGENNDVSARFVMATWQSLRGHRLADLLAFGTITHLVLDECHRSVADGISGIVQRLREHNPALRVLGLTATPNRSDKAGLSKMFDGVAYKFPINRAIKAGALVPFSALGVALEGTDISQVRQTENGWDDEELGEILSAENVKEIVFQNWQKYCEDRLTIAFTASVAQAETMADYFTTRGVSAAAVSGETDKSERRRIIHDFKAGTIRVLFNVFVLVEGFDAPETAALLMIRPTKSDLVYTQALGRGLRRFPGKTDCIVLDFAPVGGRNIVMAGDVLGVPKAVQKAQAKAEKQGVLFSIRFDELGEAKTIDPAELIVHVLDLLGSHFLAWTADNHGAVAAIGDKELDKTGPDGKPVKQSVSMLIEFPDNPAVAQERIQKAEALREAGKWNAAWDNEYHKLTYKLWLVEGRRAALQGHFPSIDAAKDKGDEIATTYYNATLGDKKRGWRKEPASDKQIAYLKQRQVEIPANLTKGHAAQLITGVGAWDAVKKSKAMEAWA